MYLFIYRLIHFIAWPQFSSAKQIKYCNQSIFYLTNVCLPCLLAWHLYGVESLFSQRTYLHDLFKLYSISKFVFHLCVYRVYNITISHNKRSGTEQNLCDVKINLQICPVLDNGSNQVFYLIHNYVAFDQYTDYG